MRVFNLIKKMLVVASAATIVNAMSIPLANADDSTTTSQTLTVVPAGVDSCTDTNSCLQAIMQNTYATLQSVNNIPVLLHDITVTALSWYTHDDTPAIQAMQSSFTTLGNILTQNVAFQNNFSQQMTADVFGVLINDMKNPTDKPKILTVLPNINELSYPLLLGITPVKKGQADPYNYIKAAGGLTLTHAYPPAVSLGASWGGYAIDQQNYIGYYYTVMAVESFDAYVLSSLYADNKNFQQTGTSLSPTQATLVSEASNGDWLTTIASEDLGKVLRQILVFQSQSYVLLSDLVQTERQILTAHVMTNSLLIAANIPNETSLLSRAKTPSVSPK